MTRKPKSGQTPWAGTDANERQYNSVHNALVGIILDGVSGVSPELSGHGHRMVSPDNADKWIGLGRRVLADFESQACAPGGARGKAQKWMNHKIDDLRRLVSDAEAVRSGKRPQKQTPESYDELRKSLGVHAGRRRAAPRPPEPVTPPSHDAPPTGFRSAGGRTFTIGASETLSPKQGQSWEILYNGEDAGKLWCDGNYGPSKPWHASTRGLFWRYASDAPTGVGFDVAAFATAQQALDAWGHSADQILDWFEGKPVHTGYGHGSAQRPSGPRTMRERHELTGPNADGVYRYRGASIELNSLGSNRWWATVRFRSQETDLGEERSSDAMLEKAKEWVDAAPELRGAREAAQRTSRGRFTGKQTPAPNPGMDPFAPQAQVRLEDKWRLGDAGAVYEFNVKLYRIQSSATEEEWEQDRVLAVEEFETELRNKYPWIGEMYMTGRSAGWFAIEDPEGKMTKKTLEAISGLVEAAKRRFVKDMEEIYPRRKNNRQ